MIDRKEIDRSKNTNAHQKKRNLLQKFASPHPLSTTDPSQHP